MKSLIILVSCVAIGHCTFYVAISCQTCTIPCPYSKCFRLKSGDFNKQVCTSSACDLNNGYNAALGRCTYDMYGKNCSTGICLEPEAKGCGTTLKFTQCGSILRWYQISCAGCTKTIACNKCLLYQGSAMKDTEECIGTTCNDVQTLNVSVATCPNKLDYYGNTCQCCYSLNNQNLTKTGKCSNEFELFNQSDFVAYAQKVYEMSLCVGLALVGIVGLMV